MIHFNVLLTSVPLPLSESLMIGFYILQELYEERRGIYAPVTTI